MYPKVRVRSLEEDDEFDHPASPLRAFSSLTVRDYTPPVKGSRQASPLTVPKVPKLQIPRSITPPNALPKARIKTELESVSDDISKKHSRASSLPRPRAVISSPDNDELLGSKNRTRIECASGLKTRCNLSEGVNTQRSRLTPSSTGRNAVKRVGEIKKTVHTTEAVTKKDQTFDIRVPRARIVKAKPCFSVT